MSGKCGRRCARDVILEYLATVQTQASKDDVMRETGLASETCKRTFRLLREEGHDLMERVYTPEHFRRAPRAGGQSRDHETWRPSADEIVTQALQNRHALDGWLS